MIFYFNSPVIFGASGGQGGQGGLRVPLCPPWILLLPLCNAGHFVPGGGYGGELRSLEPYITDGQFYDTWLIWERCSLA